MLNRTCLCFLIGMSICSPVASQEATFHTVHPDEAPLYHPGTGLSVDSLVIRLSDPAPYFQNEAIAALKAMNIPDDQLLLRWTRIWRLFHNSRLSLYGTPLKRAEPDALFSLIDLDNALNRMLHIIRITNRTPYQEDSPPAQRARLARHAIQTIARNLRDSTIKPLPGTVALLANTLEDDDAEICEIAINLLADIPLAAKDALPALFAALDNPSPAVQMATVSTLRKLTDAHPDIHSETIPRLTLLLHRPDFRVRYHSLHDRVLSTLESIGSAAVPSLLAALNTLPADNRFNTAIALTRIDSARAESTIPILADAFALPTRNITAVQTLEKLALEQPHFAPKIIPLFQAIIRKMGYPPITRNTHDLWFFQAVRSALERISPTPPDTTRDDD